MGLLARLFPQWELVEEHVLETSVHRLYHEYTGREAYRTEQEVYVDKYRRKRFDGVIEYKIVTREAAGPKRTIYP